MNSRKSESLLFSLPCLRSRTRKMMPSGPLFRSLVLPFLGLLALLWLLPPAGAAAEALSNPLPDTGQVKCYDDDGAEISCPAPGEAFYGQDAQYNPAERQPSYTKLDEHGNDLPFSATIWYQVRDNVTGLIWEVKHSKNHQQKMF